DPVPPTPWTGVWNASLPGAICLQIRRLPPRFYNIIDPIIGDEDCLFLNIYTPKLPTGASNPNLDVLFNIHSGAFMYGWGHEFGPEILMDRDIIWVTINYRLGALGFLETEDEVVPGNMGMKDQTMALQWVKENIAKFGGNPNSITLTGTSAGGVAVHFHYMSPMSRGLFKGGIAQSGTTLVSWALMEEGLNKAKKLGELVGCSTETTEILVDCLRQRPSHHIVKQYWNFQVWMYNPFSPFAPTIEKAGPNPFLSKHPIDHLLEGDIENVPWITSVTTEDGLVPAGDWIANENTVEELDRRFNEYIPNILDYNYTVPEERKKEVAERIRQHYFKDKPLSEKINEIVKMVTDRVFLLDAVRALNLGTEESTVLQRLIQDPQKIMLTRQESTPESGRKHVRFPVKASYLVEEREQMLDVSMYEYHGMLIKLTPFIGTCHLDDTAYTIEYAFKTDETQEDRDMSNVLLDMWTSFAATGNPVPSGSGVKWEPVTPNSKDLAYLYIGGPKHLEMRSSSKLGNPDFWDSLPFNERQVKVDTPLHASHTDL
ncbi:hypothetical protein ANN_12221, partial [Periplaneta americana]